LKIGVIGVGFGTTVHIPAFQSEGVEVLAVAARHKDRALQASEEFNIPHYFDDYKELLAMEDLDAVSICSPHHLHYEMVLEALKQDKHILCEKPFATNTHEALQMLNAAKGSKKTLMVAHEFRWAPQRAFVKQLLEENYIGDFRFLQASLMVGPTKEFRPRKMVYPDLGWRGGFLWGLGSHYLDAFRHWFGDIASIQSMLKTNIPDRFDSDTEKLVETTTDDTFALLLEFANGGIGTLSGSSAMPFGRGANIEIFGSSGSLSTPQEYPGFNPPPDGKVFGGKFGQSSSMREEIAMPEQYIPFDDSRDHRLMAFRLMVREFIQGINSSTSPSPNFEDAYMLQKVLEGAVQSMESGKKIYMDEM